jgi:hypothetical protein
MRGARAKITNAILMLTDGARSVRWRKVTGHANKKGRPASRPCQTKISIYRATTDFCCAIIDAIVSRIDSMLRPVSVAVSTYG